MNGTVLQLHPAPVPDEASDLSAKIIAALMSRASDEEDKLLVFVAAMTLIGKKICSQGSPFSAIPPRHRSDENDERMLEIAEILRVEVMLTIGRLDVSEFHKYALLGDLLPHIAEMVGKAARR